MNPVERSYICNLASKLQGVPYVWGGSSPMFGFDCSGFVIWILQVFAVLPSGDWTANDLWKKFPSVSEEEAEPGDLVFYGSSITEATHVGIYLGRNLAILCSGGDHTTTSIEEAKKRNAFVKIKNVHYRLDFLGYGRIP